MAGSSLLLYYVLPNVTVISLLQTSDSDTPTAVLC